MSDPIKDYQKLKADMLALKAGLTEKLAKELKTAGETLSVLKEIGGDVEALASSTVKEVVSMFAANKGKKSKGGTGAKRFSSKKAKTILNGGQMALGELAKAMQLDTAVVKANVEKLVKEFTLTGDKVKAK